jgi:hypothetical protein
MNNDTNGVDATVEPDAWARTQWPEHQLRDNGSDTPLMQLVRKVWGAAAGVPPTRNEQQENNNG